MITFRKTAIGIGITLGMILTSCGSTAANNVASTPMPTLTPVATSTPMPDYLSLAKDCNLSTYDTTLDPLKHPLGLVGNLLFTQAQIGFLSYPGIRIGDNIPQGKPYQENTRTGTDIHSSDAIIANPILNSSGGGYSVTICDTSMTQSYTLQLPSIKIASLTPDLTTSSNIQIGCDLAYSNKDLGGGGCGGEVPYNPEEFTATWPTTVAVGTSAIVKQTGNDLPTSFSPAPNPNIPQPFGNFPVKLTPHQSITVIMEMPTYPSTPGLYTFAVGMQVDNNSVQYAPNITEPVYLNSNVHKWSGRSCYSNPWKSQIPSSSTEVFYLCPVTP